jgi:branched-chain amino acid transport system ATP-binding protein
MLAIGRALLTNPRLLILDEATEGLAPIIRDEIWKTVRLIRSTGMTTLVVDKTVAAVTSVADRIVILVKGEVVFVGTPARLKANPELMHRHLGV